ncbi:ester cyclase [Mesorhizobium sp. M0659]
MAMSGIDVLRIEAGKIREVWLFSEDQAQEDAFWG